MRFTVKDQLPREKRLAIRDQVFKWVGKADYRRALATALAYKRRFPSDLHVAEMYAAVLGDYAEAFPPAKKRRLQRESIRLMRDLLRRTRCGAHWRVISVLKNEYYWQTKNRRKQFDLGASGVRRGWKGGYYSQGVGAAWHALGFAARGRKADAARWAKKAVAAWKRYERFNPGYYNQFVHRALAEGVLGRLDAMEAALQRGAKLSGKPLDYREFDEVRGLIRRLRPGPPPT